MIEPPASVSGRRSIKFWVGTVGYDGFASNVLGSSSHALHQLMTVVDAADPPLRMPFGSDTVRRIETKNAFVAEELARWRELAVSTDAKV